jgi:hypothetical protein
MKRLILIILIMQGILCPVMAYQSSAYGSSRAAETEYRRIGYTTNYANGQFNSSYYKTNSSSFNGRLARPSAVGDVYCVRTIGGYGYYNGTYTPTSGTSGRPGGPRRITVYNGNGETGQTPGGNSDSSDWLYMQDSDGNWYCSKDGGNTWFKWEDKNYGSGWNFDLVSYLWDLTFGNTQAWSTTPTTPPENSSHWAHDPEDPFLEPIDSPIIPFSILAIGYVIYKKKEEKTC